MGKKVGVKKNHQKSLKKMGEVGKKNVGVKKNLQKVEKKSGKKIKIVEKKVQLKKKVGVKKNVIKKLKKKLL